MTSLPCPAMPPADPIDAVCHPDPYPYYARLRRESAVHWFPGRGIWALVGADAVAEALASSAARVRPAAEPVPAFLAGTRAGAVFASLARMTDGRSHREHRARTLALMQRLDGRAMAEAAATAFDACAAACGHRWSGAALDRLVSTVPVMSVLTALGVPEAQRTPMLACVTKWVAGLSPRAVPAEQRCAVAAMDRLLDHLAAQGVTGPDTAAHVAVLMQPLDASAGLVGAGLLRLACDAPLREAATADCFAWDAFGQEVLRHDAPIQNTRRVLHTAALIGGQPLPAGANLLLVLGSASHDLPASEAPEVFRIDRLPSDASTIPLGSGVHRCPGGESAMAIATVVWRRLAGALGAAAPTGWRPSVNARIPLFGASQ